MLKLLIKEKKKKWESGGEPCSTTDATAVAADAPAATIPVASLLPSTAAGTVALVLLPLLHMHAHACSPSHWPGWCVSALCSTSVCRTLL